MAYERSSGTWVPPEPAEGVKVDLPGPLVDVAWLREHLGVRGLVVAEVAWTPAGTGREDYQDGHIPGAIFLDVDVDLAGRPNSGPGRHPLPTPQAFSATMGGMGIRDADAVVAYDRHGGSLAARLWWMLTVSGHPAAVLDGGLAAWTAPLENGSIRRRPTVFRSRPWPSELVADAEGVAVALVAGAAVLDARTPERYRGDEEPYDPVAGHIPGAVAAHWGGNLDPQTGRFLSPEQLRQRFEELGVQEDADAVCYCGSGVTACHDVLALVLAGFDRIVLYEGSWSDWCSDASRPVETGEPS